MFDIGVDMDGVQHDFIKSFRKYVVDSGIRTLDQCSEDTIMDFFQEWRNHKGEGIMLDQFIDICNAGVDAEVIFFYGDPFDDVKESMDRLREGGHKIHIITDRPFGTDHHAKVLTERWLDKYSIPYDTLTFSSDKTRPTTDLFIDDKIQNYDELEADGCFPFLYDRPWNREEEDNRRRVSSLAEFVDIVTIFSYEEDYQFNTDYHYTGNNK